jgi:hypothetical protein
VAARNKDVGRERVVFRFHCRKLGFDIMYRRSESLQCILKARRTHAVQSKYWLLSVKRAVSLNNMQRHYRVDFPHRITFRLASSV